MKHNFGKGKISHVWLWLTRRVLHARFTVALLMLALGFTRLNPWHQFTNIPIRFGSDMFFGICLLVLGLALLVTFPWRLRLGAKLLAALAAAFMITLGIALWPASPGSAFVDAVLALTLLCESGAYE